MKTKNTLLFSFLLLLLTIVANAQAPRNFMFISSDEIKPLEHVLKQEDIEGVQIVYNWKQLENAKDQYDFSQIENDLRLLSVLHKKLFLQIQDRSFSIDKKNVPRYLLTDPDYKGGMTLQLDNPGENMPVAYGWVTMQWVPAVQLRFQNLLSALAKQFDGRIYGINLPETSIDINIKKAPAGFSCQKYFEAEMANMKFARKVFRKSYVVQYVNFFPCEWDNDHKFMSRLFQTAKENGIGLGGPDIVPGKHAQLKNAYPFFNKYKRQLSLVAMAVQEPTLTYTNPKTKKPFTKEEFTSYAENFLGVDIIFWSASSPWIRSLTK